MSVKIMIMSEIRYSLLVEMNEILRMIRIPFDVANKAWNWALFTVKRLFMWNWWLYLILISNLFLETDWLSVNDTKIQEKLRIMRQTLLFKRIINSTITFSLSLSLFHFHFLSLVVFTW